MKFELIKEDAETSARAGVIELAHGKIETPIFMPVGTIGSVKAVQQRELKNEVGAQIILGNTYHLYLRPGTHVLENAGGLHKFIHWDRPILTDSGGYQVFSLSGRRKIQEEGVTFSSHIDGSKHLFSPESVMDIQRSIGADIIMAFDECPPYPADYKYVLDSMNLTHRWLNRCINHLSDKEPLYGYEQNLFPIVQGGTYKDLRKISAEYIAEQNCSGNAIGGLSVGEPAELMYEMTAHTCEYLPKNKPRYLMGVGTPQNILECISLGVDMFDCVMPTRNGRNGMLFTADGILNMRNEKWKNDFSPIDESSNSELSRTFSKAYLRHLFISKEILALEIASLHNLAFYLWLVKEARKQIVAGTFPSWKKEMSLRVSQRI
jgi:queuine tRNA-ribosyltransferase